MIKIIQMNDHQIEILKTLKQSPEYTSGQEFGRKCRISRSAIWKNINELRRMGYHIEAVPHQGYRLVSSPDKLSSWELMENLDTKVIGSDIRIFDSLPSTMDEAFQAGVEGAPDGTIICSEEQTNGRGRMERGWFSPRSKGIYASIILRPYMVTADVSRLTLVSAVALCEALNETAGISAGIKWPNDVLINQKKVAGILTELNAEMDRVKFVIVGLGINVNAMPDELPEGATSLKMVTGRDHNRKEVFKHLCHKLDEWYVRVCHDGFTEALERWKKLSVTIGSHVRISDHGAELEGEAVGLSPEGGLLLKTKTGTLIKRMSGDVQPVVL